MAKAGRTLGFYGGIALLDWIYQILLMPKIENKILDEIDLIFSQPISQLMMHNLCNTTRTLNDLVNFRFGKVLHACGGEPRN
ncbi:uncharacterized protein Z518_04120 [Rhinocladiella mackenziei CBS 650.93]|uniref:Uncharacterized protein n=1 Tax=Rhinocladiella mackenziei CBS 650.93 TaxID=1442369 RepID=A0A0D2ISL5_9EURO|nr:uncharacterized protein Z518_04120 [Rhinocladiella mackenziei CBS 650.93]KIX06146.1 hypothetical protein Z518_04120 [Rhinocladiella mackenziei CBS 650.93]